MILATAGVGEVAIGCPGHMSGGRCQLFEMHNYPGTAAIKKALQER
jgi:hypothetical protein